MTCFFWKSQSYPQMPFRPNFICSLYSGPIPTAECCPSGSSRPSAIIVHLEPPFKPIHAGPQPDVFMRQIAARKRPHRVSGVLSVDDIAAHMRFQVPLDPIFARGRWRRNTPITGDVGNLAVSTVDSHLQTPSGGRRCHRLPSTVNHSCSSWVFIRRSISIFSARNSSYGGSVTWTQSFRNTLFYAVSPP